MEKVFHSGGRVFAQVPSGSSLLILRPASRPRPCLFWWIADVCFLEAAVRRILIATALCDSRVLVQFTAAQVSPQRRRSEAFDMLFHIFCVLSPKLHKKK
jgi:hypothetical protein